MTDDEDTMLQEAAQKLVRRGFENPRRVTDLIEDRGATHFLIEKDGRVFSVRGKEYRYKGKASFGLEHVEQADEMDHTLVSYIARSESFRAYHPAIVLDEGRVYQESSKKSASRTWIECSKDLGGPLALFLDDPSEIETPSGDNQTLGAFAGA